MNESRNFLRPTLHIAFALVASAAHAAQSNCALQRLSVTPAGIQLDGDCTPGGMTPDGRFVVISTVASGLIAGDNLGFFDTFVLDTSNGTWSPVSVGPGSALGNSNSWAGPISDDGRWVAFLSWASNLEPTDTPSTLDVFVRDRTLGTTRRLTSTPFTDIATYFPADLSLSGDGRYVAFRAVALLGETTVNQQIYRYDLLANALTRVSSNTAGGPGSGGSARTAMSYDGRFVAFVSAAPDLIASDTNSRSDAFVRDMSSGACERVNVGPGGLAPSGTGYADAISISRDGRFVAFADGSNNWGLGPPSSTNGLVYVRDRLLAVTTIASPTVNAVGVSSWTWRTAISDDGNRVAFDSYASNFVASDTNATGDVFLRDRLAGTTTLISVAPGGGPANNSSAAPALSANGYKLVFVSSASNLIAGDTNGKSDMFSFECVPPASVYCTARTNSQGCLPAIAFSGTPSASSSQPFVVSASHVLNQRNGLLFYGYAQASAPFQGGFLCVQPPTRRTPLQNSGGTTGLPNCTGAFAFDFNAQIQSGLDANLAVGANAYCQYWSRDPFASPPTNFTDAVRLTIQP